MFDLQQKADNEGRQSEAKVWSVLVAQIWTGLAGYCHATLDLSEVRPMVQRVLLDSRSNYLAQALTPAFSQLLSQLLYSQPELRPAVLKALKIMVESNVNLASATEEKDNADAAISSEEAARNVAFLKTQVESWLAVFFNVFGSVGRDARGMVGDVISVWSAIAEEAVSHKCPSSSLYT